MIVTLEVVPGQLADLIKQVQAGDEILLTQNAKPVAKLVATPEGPTMPRKAVPIRSVGGHRVLIPNASQAELAEEMFQDSKINDLEREFNERAGRWEAESAIHSSPGAKFLNKDLLFIIGRGRDVVPLILKRLGKTRADWIWALEHIIPEDQHPIRSARSFKIAVGAWLEWGRKNHYTV